jgi:hypothetical protein
MAQRPPLPSRQSLINLNGLQTALVSGANAVSNIGITTANVLGFINSAEDDIFLPLKLIWMRQTDEVSLDVYGHFDLRTATSYPVREVVSVFSRGGVTGSAGGKYWQYEISYDRKDLNSFRKLQGNVNVEPIYTVDQSLVKVWPPANYYGPIFIEYYADWPRLGDISSNSSLQVQTLTINTGSTASGSITFTTGGTNVVSISIGADSTPTSICLAIANTKIPYAVDSGGNTSYWTVAYTGGNNFVTFTAPIYVGTNASFAVSTTATGVTFTNVTSTNALLTTIQTNWFTTNYPYLYYFASLKQIFLWLRDLDSAKWASDMAMKLVSELQADSDRADFSDPSNGFLWNQNCQW